MYVCVPSWLCHNNNYAHTDLNIFAHISLPSFQIMKLEIEEISGLRSFVFLWCGSGEGLDLGRMVSLISHFFEKHIFISDTLELKCVTNTYSDCKLPATHFCYFNRLKRDT